MFSCLNNSKTYFHVIKNAQGNIQNFHSHQPSPILNLYTVCLDLSWLNSARKMGHNNAPRPKILQAKISMYHHWGGYFDAPTSSSIVCLTLLLTGFLTRCNTRLVTFHSIFISMLHLLSALTQ